jgi:hypothetical protein
MYLGYVFVCKVTKWLQISKDYKIFFRLYTLFVISSIICSHFGAVPPMSRSRLTPKTLC